MWYNKYVGIPYKDNGRDEQGLDCWGLVRLVYKKEYDIDLPSFDQQYFGARDVDITTELIAQNKENWQPTADRIIGSVVLLRILNRETHVGIYVGNNKFLHAREGHASVIESLDSSMWKHRLVGFFKYAESSGIVVTSRPNPLKTQKYVEVLAEGCTVKDVVNQINEKYKVSNKLKDKIVLMLNGKLVNDEDYNRKLTKFDYLEYRLVPSGNNPLRSILMVAVMIASIASGQLYGVEFAKAIGFSAATASAIGPALLSVAVNVVGMALVDAIAPIRLPNQNTNNPGTPAALNLFSGGSNRANPYGTIPVILGRVRVSPPLS